MAKEIAPPQSHYAYTLIELISIADFKVAQQALELLINIFDNRRNLLIEIPQIQLLHVDGVMDKLLLKYTKIYKNIFSEKSKILGIKDPERNCGEVVKLFTFINNEFTSLIEDFCFQLENGHAMKLSSKGLILKHSLKVELPDEIISSLSNQKGYGTQYNLDPIDAKNYCPGKPG